MMRDVSTSEISSKKRRSRIVGLSLVGAWAVLFATAAGCSSASTDPLFENPDGAADGANTEPLLDAAADRALPGTNDDASPDGGSADAAARDTSVPDSSHPRDAQTDAATDSSLPDGNDGAPADTGTDTNVADTNVPDTDVPDTNPPPEPDAGDCGTVKVFTTPLGPYCPFTAAGPTNCNVGDHCCEYTADSGLSSSCNTEFTGCASSPSVIDWGCDEKNDCAGGDVCCISGDLQKNLTCPIYTVSGLTGSTCRTGSCRSGESIACGGQADCASGTCTGFNVRGKDIGFCAP